MDQGYLGIFRKFFNEHEFWKEKRKYSKAEAWIDLMQSARYGEEPETLFDKRGSYVLEYGDVYISLRYLGERWQWSKNKVQGFLLYLEKRESILVKKRDSHRTVIHIANLKGYTEWIKGERDSEGTVKGQSRDSEGTKKKKVKKEKKVKNREMYEISFSEFWGKSPSRNGKKIDKPAAKEKFFKLKESDLANVIMAVCNYAESEMVKKGMGIKDPHRFLSNRDNPEFWKEWIEPEKISDNDKEKQDWGKYK